MRFNSINIIYNEETDELQSYIVSYTSRKDNFSIDGQLTIPAEGIELGNILEEARKQLALLIQK